jgi:hypothetical protein
MPLVVILHHVLFFILDCTHILLEVFKLPQNNNVSNDESSFVIRFRATPPPGDAAALPGAGPKPG